MKIQSALFLLFLSSVQAMAQQARPVSPIDPQSYGVVLDNPATKKVTVKTDVTYLADAKGTLHLDIYSPPLLKTGEKRPAILFLNAIGERPGQRKVKSWGIYTSWPKLMAANGYIGISMETDGSRIQESIEGAFKFIAEKGGQYHINADKLGVYAASANVGQSAVYLMGERAYPGIKAAVLYYGSSLSGPFRKDLPVLFVIAEGDARRGGYSTLFNEVLKNYAPWTIKMGSGMPHAFDAYKDDDEARKIIKETISFWKNNLDPVPAPSWKYSEARDILGSIQLDQPKAVRLLKAMSLKYPDDMSVTSFYGDVLRDTRQYAEAETVYKNALRIQPSYGWTLISLAEISFAQGKIADGEKYVADAEAAKATSQFAYSRLARTLLIADKNREAAQYYEKAIALEPTGGDYYNLACAYAKANDKDKAFTALDNAVKHGVTARQQFEADADLNSLKVDERFKTVLEKTQ